MGEQQQGQQAQQHEEGESAGARVDLQWGSHATASDAPGAGGHPLPALDVRPLVSDDTQSEFGRP